MRPSMKAGFLNAIKGRLKFDYLKQGFKLISASEFVI